MSQARAGRAFVLAVALVLAGAFALRVVNLDWSLPSLTEEAVPVHVAIDMWGFESGEPSLDPDTLGWPALGFYVQRSLQQVHYLVGDFEDPMDYYVAWRLDPTGPVMLGRATSAFCMLVVVFVAMLIGRRLAGLSGAVVAGALCALSPLLVRHAQLVEPDALVAMFSALALLWMLRVARRGSLADYVWCGVWIGLGTASKYTPALLAASLVAVHLDRLRPERPRWFGLAVPRLWVAFLSMAAAFLLTNPYFLGDLDLIGRDFGYQATHMSAGHFGHTRHGSGYAHYLLSVLPGALGIAGFVAGVLGLALGFRDRTNRALVWYAFPWLVVLGAFSTSFDRYMLPVVLPFACGVALLVARIRRPALSRAAAILLCVQPAWASVEYQRQQSADDTRDLAREWVLEHVDREMDTIALEYQGPDLEFGSPERIARESAFARMSEGQKDRLLAGPVFRALRIPMYSVRADLTGFYYDPRHYLAFDWVIVSGGVSRRYLADPERFPEQAAFYRLLAELGQPAWSVAPEGRLRGPRIDIYRIDDAWREGVRSRVRESSPEEIAAGIERTQPQHFVDFVLRVAQLAEFEEQWRQAAPYYGAIARAAPDADHYALGLEKCGAMLFSAGELGQAALWYEQLATVPSHRLVAFGNLGLIAERQGDYRTARQRYEALLDSEEYAGWARTRLQGLPD